MSQKLIITASKQSDSDAVTDPSPSGRAFLGQKNPSEAKVYLYHMLNLDLNILIYIISSLATALYTTILFWDRQDTPSNFSFFLMPCNHQI